MTVATIVTDTTTTCATLNSTEHRYFIRPRVSALLANATRNPLAIVCAGTGYGKTRAVSDFVQASGLPTIWVQLSELDNSGSRFWESFVYAYSRLNQPIAEELLQLGFPDTEDKLVRCMEIRKRDLVDTERILVLDDFHLVINPEVIHYVEWIIHNPPANCRLILICREMPQINILSMRIRNVVPLIHEEDLNFTQSELDGYFTQQGLPLEPHIIHRILQDTGGWAFSVNLIAESLKNSPGYSGYTRNAMKQNIFSMIEADVWNMASEKLKRLWASLSLVEHLSADLVAILIGEDEDLLLEFKLQSAYVRFNDFVNAYMIHHQFLAFLRTKQEILTDDERHNTYKSAAEWCKQNGFITDALSYYEKDGDYESISSVFNNIPSTVPNDLALHAAKIFERAPEEAFERVPLLATRHLRVLICLSRWREYFTMAEYYKQKLLKQPEDDPVRNLTLGLLYYGMGATRYLMSTMDHCYDFDKYFITMDDYLKKSNLDSDQVSDFVLGPWVCMVGSADPGALEKYMDVSLRMIQHTCCHFNGFMTGSDDLARGELLYYQGDVKAAERLIIRARERSMEKKQYDIFHRSLFYIMRIAISRGNYGKADEALKGIRELLNEPNYFYRFTTYDIALGWYYYLLNQPEMIPGWLKGKFAPCSHPYVFENFGNQMKARHFFLTRNFPPLLAYIDEMRHQESALFGRIEMLLFKACSHYQMKDKTRAFAALRDAYVEASPNNILAPFVELGKHMRSLSSAALRDSDVGIPRPWLEIINRKAAIYAQHQAVVISSYEKESGATHRASLSPRETEVLHGLYHGLSRNEIATDLGLSDSTVKMIVNNIYDKMKAHSVADIIRIAAEQKLV